MEPIEPATPPPSQPMRLGGISRGLATIGLAVGLLAVGGAAAVMAASPDPSSSPNAEHPAVDEQRLDDDRSWPVPRRFGRAGAGSLAVDRHLLVRLTNTVHGG